MEGYILERLDRVVASSSWCARFPHYKVVNGNAEQSDHRPVILWVDGSRGQPRRTGGEQAKRFEARWLLEEGCDEMVRSAWERTNGPSVASRLAVVNQVLHTWSRDVLGDLKKRTRKLKEELERIRREPLSQD